jgi:hypothetical protein
MSTGRGKISVYDIVESQWITVVDEKSPEVISARGAISPGANNRSAVDWRVGLEGGLVGSIAKVTGVWVLVALWPPRGVGTTGVGGMIN